MIDRIPKDRYLSQKNEALTQIAKTIFGDFVQEVLVSVDVPRYPDGIKDAEADLALNVGYHKRDEVDERDGDMIDLDYGNIIIRFTNGNVVRITTSEWGDISKVDPSYILEVK